MVLYGCTRFGFVLLTTLVALSCLRASLAAPPRPILPAYTETGHHAAFWNGNAGAALRAERSRFDPTLATLRAHPIFVGRGTRLEARALDLVSSPDTKVSHVLNIPHGPGALQAFRAGALRKIHVMVPVPVNQEWYSMLRIPYTPESQQHPPLLIYELFVDRMLPRDYIKLIGAAIVQKPQNPFNFLIRWNSSPAVTSIARIQEHTRSF
ncbi:hypothetical protein PANT_18d00066 [Moesziomyces antarcticus T-34]|uniref:Uncharacterized protein n=1 Tax=Pseudozyma antarctica (strain T-34) TaxID=1151754 RepID=M9LYE5_PSEA3|nr:hypothetical protein PANT_18d00066 [Moesziomyces antarcticus T-34]